MTLQRLTLTFKLEEFILHARKNSPSSCSSLLQPTISIGVVKQYHERGNSGSSRGIQQGQYTADLFVDEAAPNPIEEYGEENTSELAYQPTFRTLQMSTTGFICSGL